MVEVLGNKVSRLGVSWTAALWI